MRQTALFGQTTKAPPSGDASINAKLLTQGGFIHKNMAGVYTFLPLGYRVLKKIENIVREEMDKIGQELLMPAISPKELWKATDRLEAIDVLFKVSPANAGSRVRNDAEYILNPTHEDVITAVAAKFNVSYRDLPFAVYQIQSKFRNEERPKSGLLRAREFRMKDLYSFHRDREDLERYYAKAKDAYMNVFARLGIGNDTYYTAASGGDFTDGFSHEFQTACETGEDEIFFDPKRKEAYNREVAPSAAPEIPRDPELRKREDVKGEGIVGVDALAKFLQIPPEQTTKTLVYETETGEPIVAAVRGDYDINEWKLAKVAGVRAVRLADESVVKNVTGAAVGYAGLLNLPVNVRVFVDDALEHRTNFEVGANRTNYHTINVNWGRDIRKPARFYDLKLAKKGDMNPASGEPYTVIRASEVGNIFPLNTKFSKALNYTYTDEEGTSKVVYMGSYGIGTSRIMGVLVEKFHDANGICWPKAVAPFQVHLLDLTKEGSGDAAALAAELTKRGFEVLFDDRSVSPGEKLKDADLIGIPVRLVISEKTKGMVEWKLRTEERVELVRPAALVRKLEKEYDELP